MISLLDKYILRTFLIYFLGILIVFSSLFIVIDCIPILTRFDVNLETILRYYVHLLPEVIYTITPASSIVASILCLYQLNKTKEIIAFFSLGIGFLRICFPILGFLVLLSFLMLWWNEKVLPYFATKKDYIYYVEIKKAPSQYSAVRANKIWFRSDHIIFNIQNFDLRKSKAQGITVYFFNKDWSLAQLITAQEMQIRDHHWILENGRSTIFVRESKYPLTKAFSKKILNIDENINNLQLNSKAIKSMSLSQMRAFIEKNKESGLDTLQYELEYHKKISFSFASLLTSLLAMLLTVPFKKQKLKGKNFFQPGICIFVSSLYWVLIISLMNLGNHAILTPLMATWGAHIIALISSILLLFKNKILK